jgi:glycerate dehydrogenase
MVVLDGGTLNPGDLSWDQLNALGTVTVYEKTNAENVLANARNADILIVNKVKLTADILQALPQLKYIAITATGFDNVDIAFCRSKNIPVSNIKNYGSATVAQHVFALILALTNRVEQHHAAVNAGIWQKKAAFSFWNAPIIELSNKTIGIIGWGNIGQKVAKIANGFEMKVLFHSKTTHSSALAEWVELDDLITYSDFISLHTHLSSDNIEMVNSAFLNQMKPTAYLINTSRGKLVNEHDLAFALNNQWIAGAGLDVLSQEPPPNDHPLLHLSNCIVTPHNAWASVEARQRMMHILNENIESFLKGCPKNLISE